MYRIPLLWFVMLSIPVFAQKKIVFLDEGSQKPISNVNVFALSNHQATFSNLEGKVSLDYSDQGFRVSHVNYMDTLIVLDSNTEMDIILLIPRAIELSEVQIQSFDLRKALQYVLDNFDDLYVNVPTEKLCTFKESFLVNGEYKRFILSQLNWWSKSSARPYKGNYSSFAKLRLQNIDIYRNDPTNFLEKAPSGDSLSRSSSVTATTLINNIYLNYVIKILLAYPGRLEATLEEAPEGRMVVSYETQWKQLEQARSRAVGRIVFDKATRAIIQYDCNIDFKGNVTETKVKGGDTYSYEQKKSEAHYTFDKTNHQKWSLKNCEFYADGALSYRNKTYDFVFENSLYILKEFDRKKVDDAGLIDLIQGIYQHFPRSTIVNANPILLTQKEQDFINKTRPTQMMICDVKHNKVT